MISVRWVGRAAVVAAVVLVAGVPASADFAQQTVDLLRLVDVNRDAVAGTWTLEDGVLYSDTTPAARISFEYRPPMEYDYTVVFSLSSSLGNIAQLVSHGDVAFAWSTNAGTGQYCRLEDINGHSVIGNPTLTPYPFQAGTVYTSTVRVRNDRVTCLINDEVLVDYATDYSDLSRNVKWAMPDQLNIGLGCYSSAYGPDVFYSAAITPVPEPVSLVSGLVGLVCIGGYLKHRLTCL